MKTRNHCKRCRFDKCVVSSGMKREWVLEQYIPKVDNIKTKKDHSENNYSKKPKRVDVGIKCALISNELSRRFVKDDIGIVYEICQNYDIQYKSVKLGEQLIKLMIFSSIYNIPLSREKQREFVQIQTQRIVLIAKCFPEFVDLPSRLQEILLKQNAFMVYTVIQATSDKFNTIDARVNNCLNPNDSAIMKCILASVRASHPGKFSGLETIDPQIDILIREYDDFVSHKAFQILKRHIRRNLAQNHDISVLIAYAALFTSDIYNENISDIERRKIGNIQENILLTLQRYLYVTNSHSVALVYFTQAVETLIKLREVPAIVL